MVALGTMPTPPMETLGPRPIGASWRSPKQQPPRVGSGATKEWAQQGSR